MLVKQKQIHLLVNFPQIFNFCVISCIIKVIKTSTRFRTLLPVHFCRGQHGHAGLCTETFRQPYWMVRPQRALPRPQSSWPISYHWNNKGMEMKAKRREEEEEEEDWESSLRRRNKQRMYICENISAISRKMV